MSKVNVNDYLTREEIQRLLKKIECKAVLEFFHTWVWVAFAFAISGLWPNPFTIVISMFIIGGKQLACVILMHDCAHRSMFGSKWANTFFCNWLTGYPILHDMERYRPCHIEHHVKTGTDDNPDLSITKGYPTTIISFIKKVIRDLIGASGIKGNIAVLVMHYGYIKYELGERIIKTKQQDRFFNGVRTFWKNRAGSFTPNFVIFGFLWLLGTPWLYILWIGVLTYHL